MAHTRKKVSAAFYRSDSGSEPVREWLLNLDNKRIARVLFCFHAGKKVVAAWNY